MAQWYKIASITTTGSAGSATGTQAARNRDIDTNAQVPSGWIMGFYIDFTTMPATTDVTINRIMPNGAAVAILTTTNVNTDGWYPVKEPSYSTTGAASSSDLIYPYTANGFFSVSVAQGDAVTNGVVVWVAIE